MEALTALIAAMAVLLFAVYVARARALTPSESRIRHLTPQQAVRLQRSDDGEMVLRRGSSNIPVLMRALDTNGYTERWTRQLERADLKLRPGEYFLIRLSLAAVTVLFIALIGQSPLALIIGAVAGVVAFMLPAFWVNLRIARRMRRINGQLVEAVTMIANGLRAGFAFAQSVDVAAGRVGGPLGAELNHMLLDINLGASTEEALTAMNERINSDDVDMVVSAILIQRNTGGNLAEVLESVTETMRERERIYGEIRTMTAQQRLTGWVLTGWPILLALVFFAINPTMMSLLWTTTPGYVLLGIWIVLNVLGFVAIRRILDIDV